MIEPLPRILVSELCKFVMAILNILRYPDERLHKIATEVPSITREIRTLVSDMAETMYAAPGIGLAATQVDVHQRIIVIDVSETRDELLVLINPEILEKRGKQVGEEGCLSIPGFREDVARAMHVRVRAQNVAGEFFETEGEELLARAVQHELDHLNGILFLSHLSPLKRDLIRRKIRKLQKAGEWE
ncbi:MAG: peptide deformylase [Nitrosomonas sp.]|nr:peptide deformylase [Nitrosomonas sp.]